MSRSLTIEVTCYTDPGCSWAWGSEGKLRRLRYEFPDRLSWRFVMGGLVGDMAVYAPGLVGDGSGARLARYWQSIAAHTGMPTPADLPRAYRSTEPAGRAVKAAELQGAEVGWRVLRRLRESIFILCRPTDNEDEILAAIRGVPGLDEDRFVRDLRTAEVEAAYRRDWEETRHPNEYVCNLEDTGAPGIGKARETEGRLRYVFPTLVFRGPAGEFTAPGWQAYEDYLAAMEGAAPGATAHPHGLPVPAQVLRDYGTAATKEIEVICGLPPESALAAMRELAQQGDVVAYPPGQDVFWLTPEEARPRGLMP